MFAFWACPGVDSVVALPADHQCLATHGSHSLRPEWFFGAAWTAKVSQLPNMVDLHVIRGPTQFASVCQQSLHQFRPICPSDVGYIVYPRLYGCLAHQRAATQSRHQWLFPKPFERHLKAGQRRAFWRVNLCRVATPHGSDRALVLVGQRVQERLFHHPTESGEVATSIVGEPILFFYTTKFPPTFLNACATPPKDQPRP